ncbi:hypothetical protein VTK73DRAFT_1713 [Phialemonium thermophilum]|uniref:Uncharacterized protein n=1 Tax=Phialemonium thermophilum TaxID=223376 RepID=A0ABR3VT40_9PEZI
MTERWRVLSQDVMSTVHDSSYTPLRAINPSLVSLLLPLHHFHHPETREKCTGYDKHALDNCAIRETPIPTNMSERGHQSPPPERSSGRQMKDTPASGQGTDDSSQKDQSNKKALENLSSNPVNPIEAEVDKKFQKTEGGPSSK